MAYTTLADLKTYLGISSSTDDTLLQSFIDQGVSFIEHYCRRRFEATTATRYYDPTVDVVDGMLLLDDDLLTVTSLTVDGTVYTSGQYTLLPRNHAPKAFITLKSSSGLGWTYSNDPEDSIVIVGTWAYSTTPPVDIVYTLHRLAAYYYSKKDAQVFEDTSFAQAGVVTLPQGVPQDIKAALNQYRRRRIIA